MPPPVINPDSLHSEAARLLNEDDLRDFETISIRGASREKLRSFLHERLEAYAVENRRRRASIHHRRV